MEDPSSTTQQVVPPVQQAVPVSKRTIPDEPPAFMDAVREADSIKDLLSDELIQPHIYLIMLISFTVLVAIVIAVVT